MIVISACIVGFLAGIGTGLVIMAVLTAGSRADAWSNGYKAGASAERAVERLHRERTRCHESVEDR